MRHAMDHRKLRRNPSQRKALLRNLMNALVRSERIETTVARAKELRRLADRLITLGKRDTLHARRRVFSLLSDKKNTNKLFAGLAGRFAGRAGGYTRILRTGFRDGDGADMAIIEYLPAEEKAKKSAPAKGKKKPAVRGKAAPAKEKTTGKARGKNEEGAAPAPKEKKGAAEKKAPAERKPRKPKKDEPSGE